MTTVPMAIAQHLTEKLGSVTVANGFNTDAGARTYRGRRRIYEKDMPCIVVIEMFSPATSQTKREAKIDGKFIIEAHSKVEDAANPADPSHPNDVGHTLLQDLMRAVFTDPMFDYQLSGINRQAELTLGGYGIAPRDDGIPAVAVELEVQIAYAINKGNP